MEKAEISCKKTEDIYEKTGIVCGRFQIFHLEHLQYVMAAWERCEHLIVGITSPDPGVSPTEQADVNRTTLEANPCTYYERMKMVEAVLLEQGLQRDEFDIVPYPIGCPELIQYYVPADGCHFITILDAWGNCKEQRIRDLGYRVQVLWDDKPKGISSTMIRKRMVQGLSWKEYVPEATWHYIVDHGIDQRICKMMENKQI